MLTLFRPEALVVRAIVPAHQAGEIRYAGRVLLENERSHVQFTGRLARSFHRAVAGGSGLETVVDVEAAPGADLAPGLPLRVRIVARTRPLFFLLRDALAR